MQFITSNRKFITVPPLETNRLSVPEWAKLDVKEEITLTHLAYWNLRGSYLKRRGVVRKGVNQDLWALWPDGEMFVAADDLVPYWTLHLLQVGYLQLFTNGFRLMLFVVKNVLQLSPSPSMILLRISIFLGSFNFSNGLV